MDTTLIETLDLDEYRSSRKKEEFIKKLGDAFEDKGFCFVKNHRIPEELLKAHSHKSQQFFKLPLDQKMEYVYPLLDHQVGYSPEGTETGEYSQIPDLKEFFQVGDMYPFPYVSEVSDFASTARMLFVAFRETYRILLRATAQSLGLPTDYFDDKEGNSIMRDIHYPANPNPPKDDEDVEEYIAGGNALGMCASRHTDIDMLTLLFARKRGLMLKYKGEYIPVTTPDPNMIIVNVGDMLQHLTGGKYVSGEHKVVCEPNIARSSIPFFGHVLPETSIVPIIDGADVTKFPYRTAKEYLDVRLAQIGMKKV